MIVLDLCSCEGVGASGYMRAGAEVYGVDMVAKFAKRYPGAGFHHGDALEVLVTLLKGERVPFLTAQCGRRWLALEDIDLIHASPPCQGYTRGNAGKVTSWPKLIPQFRGLLMSTRKPYVIENVKDAGPAMVDPVTLCGCMFGLGTQDADGATLHLLRPRLFEASWDLEAPRPCDHGGLENVAGAYGGSRRAYRLPWESNVEVAPRDRYSARYVRKGGYVPRDRAVLKALIGADHDVTVKGLHECIPPAYTEHVARSWLRA